jgi:hypothetical protein
MSSGASAAMRPMLREAGAIGADAELTVASI